MIHTPTLAEIIVEIETGPLAAQLAPYWAQVFVAPTEPRPTTRDRLGAWEVKTARAGRLHPDAAYAIYKILSTGVPNRRNVPAVPSRAEELEWAFSFKDVKRAKDEMGRGVR